MLQQVMSGESCVVCGDEMVIQTEAVQELKGDQVWKAYDGDMVRCPTCDFRAYVIVWEDGYAGIQMDENTPHNKMVAKKYEKSQMK